MYFWYQELRLWYLEYAARTPTNMVICKNFHLQRKVELIRLVSVYVDFNGATPITISVDTNADYAFDRRWNIRIQQIACDSVCKGTFSSFVRDTCKTVSLF